MAAAGINCSVRHAFLLSMGARTAEFKKLQAKGLGLRAIGRELKMPVSLVHKALQLAA